MVLPQAVVQTDATSHDAAPDFEQLIQDALDSLPPELRSRLSNVEVVLEDEPPPGQPLLGLYQGVPLNKKDRQLQRSAPGQDHDLPQPARTPLRPRPRATEPTHQARRAAEVAHHFGISDERLIELDRY